MTSLPCLSFLNESSQPDEALRLLAQHYHRQFLRAARASEHGTLCARLRDTLAQASSQSEALEHLAALVQQAEGAGETPALAASRTLVAEACRQLQQVMQAGGSARSLLAGETDGFHHLCLRCSQDEARIQQVRFFHARDRRPLLTIEINQERRSAYARCQVCRQPLHPSKLVFLIPAGTSTHGKGCACPDCNQAGHACLLHLYAWDAQQQRLLLPYLQQVAAPSRQQGNERAIALCWREGWYLLNLTQEPRPETLSQSGSPG